ncbi:pitrilysin family protein [Pseudomonas sp. DG56-2]|uniref:M16 family metallopeptidase n=1 Tax=Pseudomonas sp. DG56-2 TaxID=2320270 RepID=UPI0010A620A1|nr:pitrilysin family protein [Pseudomonas sp. DG56-2]
MERRYCLGSGLLGLLLFSGQALADLPVRHTFSLNNGLQVVVSEDRRAPVVTTHMLVKVGSSHEYPGQSGLSHALEHMLFRGSSKTAPGEFSQIIERLGGSQNAYTTRDMTVYYQTLPSDRLAVALELNADLLQGATLAAAEFEREIEAVKSERREEVDGYPTDRTQEQLQSIAYTSSYSTPVIGWQNDLERMSNEELKAWYKTWYAPNNVTLVVVGDVQLDEVKAQVEHYFAGFSRQHLPVTKRPLQSIPAGPRTMTVLDKSSTPLLNMAFNVPTYATAEQADDVEALRLIQALLGAGMGARLSTRLHRQQAILSSPRVKYKAISRGDTLFEINALVNIAQPRPLPEIQKAIWAELNNLKQTPPEPQELERAKALLLAEKVFAQDHLEGQAASISALLGSDLAISQLDADAARLALITPEKIQQVAASYFTRERFAAAYFQAEEAEDE